MTSVRPCGVKVFWPIFLGEQVRTITLLPFCHIPLGKVAGHQRACFETQDVCLSLEQYVRYIHKTKVNENETTRTGAVVVVVGGIVGVLTCVPGRTGWRHTLTRH